MPLYSQSYEQGYWAFCQLHMQFHELMTADVKSTICTYWYGGSLQMQAQEAEQRAEAVEAAVQQGPPQNPIKLYVTSALTAILSFAVVSGTTPHPLAVGVWAEFHHIHILSCHARIRDKVCLGPQSPLSSLQHIQMALGASSKTLYFLGHQCCTRHVRSVWFCTQCSAVFHCKFHDGTLIDVALRCRCAFQVAIVGSGWHLHCNHALVGFESPQRKRKIVTEIGFARLGLHPLTGSIFNIFSPCM